MPKYGKVTIMGDGSVMILCMFHSDTNASMRIYTDGSFYCYGCQTSRDSWREAVRYSLTDLEIEAECRRIAEVAQAILSRFNPQQTVLPFPVD